ncbi:MAG: hypothetical protein ACE5H2_07385, partial [Terriglobia bacterium]
MRTTKSQVGLALILAGAMVWYPVLGVTAGNPALGKVVPRGPAELNGTRLTLETTLYPGDTITTPAE